ncbi:MAG: non-canonical purine NTP diphosphatase [Bacteroidales bacterium]|nr:non-canonical purine NTP diphosphatase [Bacteroidales bacterium]
MKTLIFATHNKNKLKEIQQILADYAQVRGLSDINCFEDIPETGQNLEENALQKAEYVFKKYNISCFADDTGLEVEALNMLPGVHSARYANETNDSEKNIQKLWQELKGKENTKARFRTIITLVGKFGYLNFEGIVNGNIIFEKRGQKGFGYDPIFIPEGYRKTFAEMSDIEKNKISHRAIAIKKLLNHLQSVDRIK